MKSSKMSLIAALCGLTVAARAQYSSPELMLVTDAGGSTHNGNVVAPQVERYDPYTGQYLGAFGAGYLSHPIGVTVSGPDAYVSDVYLTQNGAYSRIDKFNFSTGAYDGSIFSSQPNLIHGLAKYGSSLLASDYGTPTSQNGGMYTFNANGQVSSFLPLPNGTGASAVAVDDTHAYIATIGSSLLSYNLDAQGNATGENFAVGDGNSYHAVATYRPTAAGYRIIAGGQNGSKTVIDEYDPAANLIDAVSFDPAVVNTIDSFAVGHNSMIYALTGGPDSPNEIFRFDGATPLFLGPLGHFNLNDTASRGRIAVYSAPEPFSIAGLGIGILALIRKRRKA